MVDMKIVEASTPAPVVQKDDEIKEQFSGILVVLSSFRSQITMLQNQLRGLEKNVNKRRIVCNVSYIILILCYQSKYQTLNC